METANRCLWGICLITLWLCGCPSPGDDMDGGRLPDGGMDAVFDSGIWDADGTRPIYLFDGGPLDAQALIHCESPDGGLDLGGTPHLPNAGLEAGLLFPSGTLAVADYDDDGFMDIPSCESDGNKSYLTMLWGHGGGEFEKNSLLPAIDRCANLYTADMDGDGRPDLLMTSRADSQVSQFSAQAVLNTTRGFVSSNPVLLTYKNGAAGGVSPPPGVAIADFNGDHLGDLYYCDCWTSACDTVLRFGTIGQDGAFVFGDPRTVLGGCGYSAKDVNGDGRADLLFSPKTDVVRALRGRGDGSFDEILSLRSPADWGDVNGDSRIDLVYGVSGDVNVLLGDGAGRFSEPITSAQLVENRSDAPSFGLFDVNGDGRADFVEDNLHTVGLARCDGSFEPIRYLGNMYSRGDLPAVEADVSVPSRALDFDGDGNVDLLGGGGLNVFRGHGDGTFDVGSTYYDFDTWPASQKGAALGDSADFNGDGHLDLIAVTSIWPDTRSDEVSSTPFMGKIMIRWGDGTGQFPTASWLPDTYDSPIAVVVADLNQDGAPDVVVVNDNDDVQWSLNDGKGGFSPDSPQRHIRFQHASYPHIAYPPPQLVAVGDVDGNGTPDLSLSKLVILPPMGYGEQWDQGVLLLDENGNLDRVLDQPPVGEWDGMAQGDLDGDGTLDRIQTEYGGPPVLSAFLNDGQTGFTLASTPAFPSDVALSGPVALGDLDGDGHLDAVVGDLLGVWVLYGHGDGTFEPPTMLTTNMDATELKLLDVDGDGRLDIVTGTVYWTLNLSSSLTTMVNQGGRSFRIQSYFATHGSFYMTTGWVPLQTWSIGDFDDDGKPDFALLGRDGRYTVIHNGY